MSPGEYLSRSARIRVWEVVPGAAWLDGIDGTRSPDLLLAAEGLSRQKGSVSELCTSQLEAHSGDPEDPRLRVPTQKTWDRSSWLHGVCLRSFATTYT